MTNAEARFNKSHIRKVYAYLAVTCHLHFWQNDRDFLRATVVTRGWNGYRNKSQHRKSTLEKKILPPFQQGFEPATFQSRVRRSNHWAIPAPVGTSRVDFKMICAGAPLCVQATFRTVQRLWKPCWQRPVLAPSGVLPHLILEWWSVCPHTHSSFGVCI